MPHGLEIDQNDSVWITDVALHQVLVMHYCYFLLLYYYTHVICHCYCYYAVSGKKRDQQYFFTHNFDIFKDVIVILGKQHHKSNALPYRVLLLYLTERNVRYFAP